jgi:hypothetical protein
METPPFQFGLRAIFGLTALVALGLIFYREPKAMPCFVACVCGAFPAAVFARLTGHDNIDAAFGAVYGFLVGAALWLAFPEIN